MSQQQEIFLGITGASGAPYTLDFIEAITQTVEKPKISAVFSDWGQKVFEQETGKNIGSLSEFDVTVIENNQLAHRLASGTNAPSAAIILPCSANTLAKIRCGIQDSLLLRVAAIMLKLQRPLLIVVREMPCSQSLLENMLELKKQGAHILMATPYFYHNPATIKELTSTISGYCLDLLEISHNLKVKWNG
jgi:4-hydroxy-3-polyprenylbenzoate decarboxylase